jgi:hypothetical protein
MCLLDTIVDKVIGSACDQYPYLDVAVMLLISIRSDHQFIVIHTCQVNARPLCVGMQQPPVDVCKA